jgi:hypothetical protein
MTVISRDELQVSDNWISGVALSGDPDVVLTESVGYHHV